MGQSMEMGCSTPVFSDVKTSNKQGINAIALRCAAIATMNDQPGSKARNASAGTEGIQTVDMSPLGTPLGTPSSRLVRFSSSLAKCHKFSRRQPLQFRPGANMSSHATTPFLSLHVGHAPQFEIRGGHGEGSNSRPPPLHARPRPEYAPHRPRRPRWERSRRRLPRRTATGRHHRRGTGNEAPVVL